MIAWILIVTACSFALAFATGFVAGAGPRRRWKKFESRRAIAGLVFAALHIGLFAVAARWLPKTTDGAGFGIWIVSVSLSFWPARVAHRFGMQAAFFANMENWTRKK